MKIKGPNLFSASDCGPAQKIDTTEVLSWGHHEIGNGVIYRCLKNYELVDVNESIIPDGVGILTCNASGEWNYPSFEYRGTSTSISYLLR